MLVFCLGSCPTGGQTAAAGSRYTRRVVRSGRHIERRCLAWEREKDRKRRSLVKVLDRL